MVAISEVSGLTATFRPEAGMLGCSLRHHGEEVLGPRGIPLLHPWANRLSAPSYVAAGRRGRVPDAPFVARDDHGLAIHGVSEPGGAWMVVETEAHRVRTRLVHPADADRFDVFPFPHELEVEATVTGSSLVVRTTLRPTADVAVPVCFGYHPYLRLPGVPRRDWRVELPAMTHLELGPDQLPTGRSERRPPWSGALGGQVWDDAYLDLADGSEMALSGGGRRVVVRFGAGFGVGQVFAPPTEDVVCFEPMTAPVDALVTGTGLRTVGPGSAHTAIFSIHVEGA
jgi:galactose mutarotase-like enzyme